MIVFSLSLAQPAGAQMTFVEDGGSHAILGPKVAAGAVIWSHGHSVDEEDSSAPTPGYVEAFRRQRWDAFRLNRMRVGDSLRAGAQALARRAASLKAQGYRSVVLAGQSHGAFISLIAADLSADVDAVIAVAPAAFGPVAENPAMGALNATRLYPLLERIRHARVMLFYFRDDVFDPGGRGPRSEQILSARQRPHLVIDQPASLKTHWAGSTAGFAVRFGSCIVAFATFRTADPLACREAEQDPTAIAGTEAAPSVNASGQVATLHTPTAPSAGKSQRGRESAAGSTLR